MSNTISKSLEGKILVASPHLEDPYFEKTLVYICTSDESGIVIGIIINHAIGTISPEEVLKKSTISLPHTPIQPQSYEYPLLFGGPNNQDMLVGLNFSRRARKKTKNEDGEYFFSPLASTDIALPLPDDAMLLSMLDKDTDNDKDKDNSELQLDGQHQHINGNNICTEFFFDGRQLARRLLLDKHPRRNYRRTFFARGLAAWDPQQIEEEIRDNVWFVVDPVADENIIFGNHNTQKWEKIMSKQLHIPNPVYLVHYSGRA